MRAWMSLFPLLALGGGVTAAADPPGGQVVQAQDPVEPARPIGFERRDIEEMDRQVEERRAQWRAEEEAKARARKLRKQADQGPPPESTAKQP